MKFNEKLSNLISLINDNLNRHLPAGDEVIYEAMKYSVNAGGKRFRPILILSTYEAITGEITPSVIDFACALEFIHTYSLIHDDLPSMDNDDYRRGMPTCHKKYGEAIAILAGDGLLNLAFEVMINRAKEELDTKYLRAIELIAKSAGSNGMILGQARDILSENQKITHKELMFIHKNKTSKLIQSAILSGAIIAKCNEKTLEELEDISSLLGIAFQIQDDILDFTSDTKTLGKPTFSDEKNNKSTYVTLFGLEKAKQFYEKYFEEILFKLKQLNLSDKFIYHYIKHSIKREK